MVVLVVLVVDVVLVVLVVDVVLVVLVVDVVLVVLVVLVVDVVVVLDVGDTRGKIKSQPENKDMNRSTPAISIGIRMDSALPVIDILFMTSPQE